MSDPTLIWRQVLQQVREDLRALGIEMSLDQVEEHLSALRKNLDGGEVLETVADLDRLRQQVFTPPDDAD